MVTLNQQSPQACIIQYGRVLFTGTLIECLGELCESYRSIGANPFMVEAVEAGFTIQSIH